MSNSNFNISIIIKIEPETMATDKNTIINSMNNLINHISISPSNQQQIFSSLSRKNFENIIANLEDSLPRLRIITAMLLGELLFGDPTLQKKFCSIMGLPEIPGEKIVLSNNAGKLIDRNPHKARHIFQILKQKVPEQFFHAKNTLWYINPAEQTPYLHFLTKQDLIQMLQEMPPSANQNSKTSSHSSSSSTRGEHLQFDPLQCITGVCFAFDEEPRRPPTSELRQLIEQEHHQQFHPTKVLHPSPVSKNQTPRLSDPYIPQANINCSVFSKYSNGKKNYETGNMSLNVSDNHPNNQSNSSKEPPRNSPVLSQNSQGNSLFYIPPYKYSIPGSAKWQNNSHHHNHSDFIYPTSGTPKSNQNTLPGKPPSVYLFSGGKKEWEEPNHHPPVSFQIKTQERQEIERHSMPLAQNHSGIQVTGRQSYGAVRPAMTDRTYLLEKSNVNRSMNISEADRHYKPEALNKKPTNIQIMPSESAGKVRTITLGGRGCQTTRQRKTPRTMVNWE